MRSSIDPYIITDTAVLVQYGILDIASFAHANLGYALGKVGGHFINGFIIIIAHDITVYHSGAMSNPCTYAHYTAFNTAGMYDAAFCNNRFFQRGATDLGWWQHAWTGI